MALNDVLTLINNEITANGNNEITGDVLRPVLIAIVNQINDLVGGVGDLPIGSSTVIEAINNIPQSTGVIHTGLTNPNNTPPPSFNIGDFYSQTASSIVIAFWQYNGIKWVEVLSRLEHKLRNYIEVTENYKIDYYTDDIILYNGDDNVHLISFPDVLLAVNKTFVIINNSIYDINIQDYYDLDNVIAVKLLANTSIKIVSNGIKWQQIN